MLQRQRGVEVQLFPFLTSTLDRVGGQRHCLVALPSRKSSNSHSTEVGWTQGPKWNSVQKNSLVLTGVRNPELPVRGVVLVPYEYSVCNSF